MPLMQLMSDISGKAPKPSRPGPIESAPVGDESQAWFSEFGPEDPPSYLGRGAVARSDAGVGDIDETVDRDGRASYKRLSLERMMLIGMAKSQEARRLHERRFEARLAGDREGLLEVIRSEENQAFLRRQYAIRLGAGPLPKPPDS